MSDDPRLNRPHQVFLDGNTAVGVLCIFFAFWLHMLHYGLIDLKNAALISEVHEKVMALNAPAPIAYRLLPFVLAHNWGIDGISPFLLHQWIRFLCLVLIGIGLYHLARKDFGPAVAITSISLWSALLPFSFFNYSFHGEDWLFLVAMLAYLWTKTSRKPLSFLALIAAALSRETAILLPFLSFGAFRSNHEKNHAVELVALLTELAVVAGTLGGVRFLVGPRARYTPLWKLSDNLAQPMAVLLAFTFVMPLFLAALTRLTSLPPLWRNATIGVVPFFILHLCLALVRELRLFLPVVLLLVPIVSSCLHENSPDNKKESNSYENSKQEKPPKG